MLLLAIKFRPRYKIISEGERGCFAIRNFSCPIHHVYLLIRIRSSHCTRFFENTDEEVASLFPSMRNIVICWLLKTSQEIKIERKYGRGFTRFPCVSKRSGNESGSNGNGEFTARQQRILIGSKITARHAWEIMSIGRIITEEGVSFPAAGRFSEGVAACDGNCSAESCDTIYCIPVPFTAHLQPRKHIAKQLRHCKLHRRNAKQDTVFGIRVYYWTCR